MSTLGFIEPIDVPATSVMLLPLTLGSLTEVTVSVMFFSRPAPTESASWASVQVAPVRICVSSPVPVATEASYAKPLSKVVVRPPTSACKAWY
ncbi:hypothetical protein Y695_01126 [Hydrogenophaga sp. T4]|nr:hypothetical protein Y695_01126 [Hydrogenophaga sp. T4]